MIFCIAATGTTDTFFTGTAGTAAPAERSLLFTAPDYVVFALSLYSLKSNTVENFLLGERSINFVAVALSILAALINGVFVIGIPAEMHYYGTTMTLLIIGLLLSMVITSHIFIVKYQTMTFTSAYEVI
jgi:Na+/proline symporter